VNDSAPRVAIAGVTGAVGQEFLRIIEQRSFPFSSLKLLASSRSAGRKVTFKDTEYTIEQLTEDSFGDVDLALFSAGGTVSKKFAPIASDAGATVVDNSSAFRMTIGVPLVIPEVNPEDLEGIEVGKGGIVANPNCSTIIALVAITPLHRKAGVKRMIVSTYQAASGAGAAAMSELELQTREVLEGKPPTCSIFPFQYAFNLFSHNSEVGENGYNTEEMKLNKETAKMWHTDAVRIAATCVRVPIMRAHAESITLEFEGTCTEDEARAIFADAPGVSVIDDRPGNRFPTPLDASDKDDVFVGRIRQDLSNDPGKGLNLFVCGDQIRKGAALNAIQIAERLLKAAPVSA